MACAVEDADKYSPKRAKNKALSNPRGTGITRADVAAQSRAMWSGHNIFR